MSDSEAVFGLDELIRAVESGGTTLDGKEPSDEVSTPPTRSGSVTSLPSRFRALGPLGRGGEADTLVAHDLLLERQVAIKVLRRNPFERGSGMPGLREARILARMAHPAILSVHDVVFLPERTFLVMPLIEGCTLQQVVDYLAARPVSRTPALMLEFVDLTIRMCDAVAHAHQAGALHLDIKPDNVMKGEHQQVFLLDWGSSHGLQYRGLAPEMLGTPGYAAPERWTLAAEELDARADVFGLGALLFALLEGRPPPLRTEDWDLSPLSVALDAILRSALAPNRDARTPTVNELRRRLIEFRDGHAWLPVERYPPGQLVMREGEVGSAVYFIEAGSCEAFIRRRDQERILRALGPGDTFGELAQFSGGRRHVSIRTLEATTLRVIDAATLHSELGPGRPWLRSMMASLALQTLEVLSKPEED